MAQLWRDYIMSIIVIVVLIVIMYGALLFFPRDNALSKAAEQIAEKMIEEKTGVKVDLPL